MGILEDPLYYKRYLEPSFLTEYIYIKAFSKNVSKYYPLSTVHQTVDCILDQNPQDQHRRIEYVRALCGLIVQTWPTPTAFHTLYSLDYNEMYSKPSVAQNCLVAATYLGLMPVVKAMIKNRTDDTDTVFGRAIDCAIKRGDFDLAVLLLESGTSVIGVRCIEMAGKNGQKALLDLVFDLRHNNFNQQAWFYLL